MEITESIITEKNEIFSPFETYFGGLSMGVLDIETSGFSPESSQVILVGVLSARREDGALIMKQYFAEDPGEEEALLKAVDRDYQNLDFLVTYNGRAFDLPFLEGRRRRLGLPSAPNIYNLDLYKIVRDFSDIGKFTPNLKQKTLESFLGLWQNRTDEISGGESVQLYLDYLITGASDLKEKILLHNRDDVLQLFRLLRVLPKVNLHGAMYKFGFPLTLEKERFIISNIQLKKDHLMVEGKQPSPTLNYVYYGEELPHFHFNNGDFSFSIPTLTHKSLVLVDGKRLGITTENTIEGYSVIKKADDFHYSEINLLVRLLLERMTEQWITRK